MTAQDSVNINCANCQIRHRAVCSQCDDAELNALDKIKYYKSFAAGKNIALMGDEMDFLASVVNGVATLSQTLEDGRTQMVGLLLPSDFVGRPGRKGVIYDIQAKASQKRITENFRIATFYNVIAVPVAIAGFATPLIAALAMSLSSISVTLNALRIR